MAPIECPECGGHDLQFAPESWQGDEVAWCRNCDIAVFDPDDDLRLAIQEWGR